MDLLHIYFLNEIGGKSNQEDFIWPQGGTASLHDKVFIVCDGVGGHDKGEVASRLISEYVGNAINTLGKREMSAAVVNGLLIEGRKSLIQHAHQNGLNTDMATTFTLLVLAEKKVFISWCGDSRIYHIRNGQVLYKTADHSLVNSLVKSGEITEEEALTHPRKNIILRAIKADGSPIEADHHLIQDVMDGDYFMLCTDGLLENITDSDLKFLLTQKDKGNIDIVKGFQQFCHGKTKDNYSMYLLQVKLNNSSSAYKRKIMMLVIFLLLLISASTIILTRYFTQKPQRQAEPIINVHPADSVVSIVKDTTIQQQVLKPDTQAAIVKQPVQRKPILVLPAKEPTPAKKDDSKKIRKQPLFDTIDNRNQNSKEINQPDSKINNTNEPGDSIKNKKML